MALIVLGAGATRGASFVQERKDGSICHPPLNDDFFTQLQRVANPKHKETTDTVLADVVELFGHNFRVTLETVFATIEHTLRIVRATKGTGEYTANELEEKRTHLLQAVAAVLEESLTESKAGRQFLECEYHKSLVSSLRAQDAIISFNYDCLIDHALRTEGKGKWNARYGYRLPLPTGPGTNVIGENAWNPTAGSPIQTHKTVRLLKLHGSIHFAKKTEKIFKLKERPYTRQHGNLRFEIIPPEWNKHFDEGVFGKLWVAARDEIHKAKTIVVIGYSFPAIDLHTAALFRVGVAKKRLKTVVVVNPDREARRRTRTVLERGFSPSTRVLVFNSFKEFATVDKSLWRE